LNCANCDFYFGNEGGATNIMKALDKPTFSIHSPQIKKDYWAIYEDGKKHVSIHLEDFQPQLFKFCSRRYNRKLNASLYQKLKPELISLKINNFLKNLE
jgi:heptosyltransferase-2